MRVRSLIVLPVAVATLAGLAWLPTAASAFDNGFDSDDILLAQTAPPGPPPAATPGNATPGNDRMRGPGPGAGPGARNFSPKAMCQESVARRIGMRAYLKAKLDLKPEQMAAWGTYEKAADEVSAKSKARCVALPEKVETPPSFTERMNRREEMMKTRLESLQATKPALQALYATLTPEQKVVFDRPMMGGHHGGPRHGHR